jgi:hypothetical protein
MTTKADVLQKARELEAWKLQEEVLGQQNRPVDPEKRIEAEAGMHVVRDCRRVAQEAYDETFRAWAAAGFPPPPLA